ncbi:MAG: GNAT family N-acetyltransferase [Caulobacteraceae bacterium]
MASRFVAVASKEAPLARRPVFTIVDFAKLNRKQLADAARILREALPSPDAYKAPGEAEAEVAKLSERADRFGLAALTGGKLVGWVGAIRAYSHSLELHPMAVDPPRQRTGVGAALIEALAKKARAEGFVAIHLGADDDFGGTNLFGQQVFGDVIAKAGEITADERHPLNFYRRCGFEIVGLIPDANGPGKPDILMAKRIG